MGEWINGLAAVEKVAKMEMSLEKVNYLFQDYLAHLSATKKVYFYMHSDEESLEKLKGTAGVEDPLAPKNQKEVSDLLKAVADPENVGCQHLKVVLTEESSQVRPELAKHAIMTFFNIYYDMDNPLRARLIFAVSEGSPVTAPEVEIFSPKSCGSIAPLVEPNTVTETERVAPRHVHVEYFRMHLASFLNWQFGDLNYNHILDAQNSIAQAQGPLLNDKYYNGHYKLEYKEAGLHRRVRKGF